MNKREYIENGLWVVLATPFDENGKLDAPSMIRQIDLAKSAGADGLVALGVFGESARLSLAEKREVISVVSAEKGEVPVIVGISGIKATEVTEEVHFIDVTSGADVPVMIKINSTDTDSVITHLRGIWHETGTSIILQDYPLNTGVEIESDQIVEITESCPFVIGVKAESPPTPAGLAKFAPNIDVPVFGGLGGVNLVDELAAGAGGAMTGFSYPEGLRQTIDAYTRGGFESARETWARWLPLANFEAQQGISLAVRKMILHKRGVFSTPTVRAPAAQFPDELSDLLDDHLEFVRKKLD